LSIVETDALRDIGQRLNAYRLGRNLSPEAMAKQLCMSRAALYRAERGGILKIVTLIRISRLLETSLPNLLGVGVEYVDTAVAFFERMRQIESDSDQIIGFFGPLSYLLTSENYDDMLALALNDTRNADETTKSAISKLLEILRERREDYQRRRPLLVNLIAVPELRRFLSNGLIGRDDLTDEERANRRLLARAEGKHILGLIRKPPIGVQIGIVTGLVPATNFQIFRQSHRSFVAISPFRLGEQPNVRVGVGTFTTSIEGVRLHEDIAQSMWEKAAKGDDAAGLLLDLMENNRRQ